MTTASADSGLAPCNAVRPEDRAGHEWYRFVLSFPPRLVREYLERFEVTSSQTVLDPFCGTGTTLVECKKRGIPSVGVEAHPLAQFAARVKLDWDVDPDGLRRHARRVAKSAADAISSQDLDTAGLPLFARPGRPAATLRRLPPEQEALLLKHSISPLPLHKTLVLLEQIRRRPSPYQDHERLALAKALVTTIGNLHFGPEVGLGRIRTDAPVVEAWRQEVDRMADDLGGLWPMKATPAPVLAGDARDIGRLLPPESVDAVITSPPYPNEKDYTRTTRLESVLLGFIRTRAELRALKQGLLRSNTRGVYRDDEDDRWIRSHPEVARLAAEIEARRVALGKTSGFERLYGRVTRLYFGGLARHLAAMRPVLRPGARLAYVVGDQASYLRVMIRTGQILARIAESLGYEVAGLDLFRTRLATATGEQLREEVLVLRWEGRG